LLLVLLALVTVTTKAPVMLLAVSWLVLVSRPLAVGL
jgi:hypothetical protein